MNFLQTNEKIWIEDEQGNELACVDFPEVAQREVDVIHTYVSPALQGQGIAGKLMEALTDNLLKTGRKAELSCSYEIHWFEKHKEFENLLS